MERFSGQKTAQALMSPHFFAKRSNLQDHTSIIFAEQRFPRRSKHHDQTCGPGGDQPTSHPPSMINAALPFISEIPASFARSKAGSVLRLFTEVAFGTRFSSIRKP